MKTAGIYIHVPFCRKKCDYCSFYSIPYDSGLAAKFTDAVAENIAATSDLLKKHNADAIYFGGGTPSLLNDSQLDHILRAVRDNISVSENAEITIECNPADIDSGFFNAKSDLSVNRFSIGVQTLNMNSYSFLGRNGGFADERFLNVINDNSWRNISLDYISALKNQSSENAAEEIKRMIKTGAKHFSVYLLSVEQGTPLFSRFDFPENYDDHQAEIYYLVKNILEENGYRHYEISNYSMKGYESAHNLKYWNFEEYAGFGPAAHSFINGERYSFKDDVKGFCEGNFVKITDSRTEKDALCEFIMTALRLRKGISVNRLKSLFDDEIQQSVTDVFRRFLETSMLEENRENGVIHFRVPDESIIITDTVIEQICRELV
ncbi:MAG: radical SAM family heme chaperone HemW [Spirochaetes bacterium]|nr:radical SAM family heme chaperone HemW [Spirochaetota bacterium]